MKSQLVNEILRLNGVGRKARKMVAYGWMASKLERTIVGVVAVVKFIVVSSRVESRRSAELVGAWIVSV